MSESVVARVKALQGMTAPQLRARWRDVFGTEPPNRSRGYLWRRLAWKVQEDYFGALSPDERARAVRSVHLMRGEDHIVQVAWIVQRTHINGAVWGEFGKVDHNITKVVSGVATTASKSRKPPRTSSATKRR